MKILSIETSCDETSIAIIEKLESAHGKKLFKMLAHNTISQINIHAQYGGVYPNLARREHENNLVPLLHKSLSEANLLQEKMIGSEVVGIGGEVAEFLERHEILKNNLQEFINKYNISKNINAIAITSGPGLPPALWVGVNFAKALSVLLGNVPLYPVNHMEGHIIGGIAKNTNNLIEIPDLKYPALAFLISGGHTEFVLSTQINHYLKIGETLDDAVGESYDKVARLLNLEYPGGPKLAALAKLGRSELEKGKDFFKDIPKPFPRPLIHDNTLNFSFSGLKTHVLYLVNKLKEENNILTENQKIQISTEFENTVRDVFVKKLEKAIIEYNIKSVIVGGGVASNDFLRENFEKLCQSLNVSLHTSSKELSTDNALMIALTAAEHVQNGVAPSTEFMASGSLSL